jgi:hypothetical protein
LFGLVGYISGKKGREKMKTIEIVNKKEIVEITIPDLRYDRKQYQVWTIKANGRTHTDTFNNLPEARNWAKWA